MQPWARMGSHGLAAWAHCCNPRLAQADEAQAEEERGEGAKTRQEEEEEEKEAADLKAGLLTPKMRKRGPQE
jgi:hypothetical protein